MAYSIDISVSLKEKGRLKSQVQCFSMQVVMNKCFLLNIEKILALIRLVVLEKNRSTPTHYISKNDVIEQKAIGYSSNQLSCYNR